MAVYLFDRAPETGAACCPISSQRWHRHVADLQQVRVMPMHYWTPQHRFGGVVDVSHNNGIVDWPRIGPEVKLVFTKATQGTNFVDPRYVANIAGCQATGRLGVPYHFLTAEPAEAQFEHFAKTVDLKAGMVVMVDWEMDPKTHRIPPIATMEAFLALVLDVVGSREKIVAYHGMYDLSSPAINAYPWFVPKYGPQPQGPRWLLWQFSPRGHVPGIPNPIDLSWFAGTEIEMGAWYRDGDLPTGLASPEQPQVTPAVVSQVTSAITQLQTALQLAGLYSGVIDGISGPQTISALRAWGARQG